ncbi:MAG: hypothetical protein IIB29_08860 [Chloroflexi bacterium]|nr:hypothetical protein [Chloroflexota bacterium]
MVGLSRSLGLSGRDSLWRLGCAYSDPAACDGGAAVDARGYHLRAATRQYQPYGQRSRAYGHPTAGAAGQ